MRGINRLRWDLGVIPMISLHPGQAPQVSGPRKINPFQKISFCLRMFNFGNCLFVTFKCFRHGAMKLFALSWKFRSSNIYYHG